MSYLVATDGSLFLMFGLYVDVNGKCQTDDATNASSHVQNVHIGYLLGLDSREARYSPSNPLSRVVRQPSFYRTPSTKEPGACWPEKLDADGGSHSYDDTGKYRNVKVHMAKTVLICSIRTVFTIIS